MSNNLLLVEKKCWKNLQSIKILTWFLVIIYLQDNTDCVDFVDELSELLPNFVSTGIGRQNYKDLIENIEWPSSKSRDLKIYLQPTKNTTILQPTYNCNSRESFLTIIITSSPENYRQRFDARSTVGLLRRFNNATITVNFIIGLSTNSIIMKEIKKESDAMGDIIQESFYDSYYNSTIRVGMALKWITENCKNTKYIMIIPDNLYVAPKDALKKIFNNPNKAELSGQDSNIMEDVIRDPFNEYYMPYYMYSLKIYPKYLQRIGGYMMSIDVAIELYNIGLTQPIVHRDDIFFFGICANIAGIERTYVKGFLRDVCKPEEPCITTTKRPEDYSYMYDLYKME